VGIENSVAGDLNGWRRMMVRVGTRGTPPWWTMVLLMVVGLVSWEVTGTVVPWLALIGVVIVACLVCMEYADKYLNKHPHDGGG
jgi:hypothetical protein